MSDQRAQSWTIEFLDEHVLAEFEQLPSEMQAKFFHICNLINEIGFPFIREPHIKKLEGKIYEFRLTGRDGIGRSLFITRGSRRITILRTFIKKTQKTPKRELNIAKQRAKLAEKE